MITTSEKAHALQNMGLIDRVLRLLIGVALVSVSYYFVVHAGVKTEMYAAYLFAVSLYPIFTGMFGWDPLYAAFNGKTCGDSGRNQCGTLPYQWMAMLGRAPKYCESDAEHSLEACHDEPEEHPRHKVWRVDEEPMLYPDDKAWHRYFRRKQPPGGSKAA